MGIPSFCLSGVIKVLGGNLYGTGAIMDRQDMIRIMSNSVIPGGFIYKRDGSRSKARKTGDILISPTAIARDIQLDSYWAKTRQIELTLVGPIKYLAWAGEWHDLGRQPKYLIGIVYWNYCYHRSIKAFHGQWMISFIGVTKQGLVTSLLIGDRHFGELMGEEND
jgi:hypothetical protein